jgi:hypothetical protein
VQSGYELNSIRSTACSQQSQREDADRRLGGPRKRLQQLEQQLQNCYGSAQQQPQQQCDTAAADASTSTNHNRVAAEVQKQQQQQQQQQQRQQQLRILLSDYVPRALLEELREASTSSSDSNDYNCSSEDIGGRAVAMLATALRVHVTGKLDSTFTYHDFLYYAVVYKTQQMRHCALQTAVCFHCVQLCISHLV